MVKPLLHRYAYPVFAGVLKITLLLEQKVVGPDADIAAIGSGLATTGKAGDQAVQALASLTNTA